MMKQELADAVSELPADGHYCLHITSLSDHQEHQVFFI